jgi:hypothetical protein
MIGASVITLASITLVLRWRRSQKGIKIETRRLHIQAELAEDRFQEMGNAVGFLEADGNDKTPETDSEVTRAQLESE